MRWIVPSLVIVTLLGAGLFQLRHAQFPGAFLFGADATGDSPLGLKLERHQTETDWQVTWNRNATAVLNATGGSLLISDGPMHKELRLDSNELRTGSMVYTPMTGNVVLQLNVVSKD